MHQRVSAAVSSHADRRDRLRVRLAEAGLGGLLVTDLTNVRYLTGFTGSFGSLLVTTDSATLASDGRYTAQAAAQTLGVELLTNPDPTWLRERLDEPRLGLESHAITWDAARELTDRLPDREVVAAPGHVEALRVVKDAEEVAALRRACALADDALATLLHRIEPGMSELAVGRQLDRTMVDLGAADRSFETIVASGPNSAVPHHPPTDRALQSGDLVKLDFGALVDGYHSDMTRMLALGDPGAVLHSVFDLVRAAQQAGVDRVRDGVTTGEVDAACRDVIAQGGHAERFTHGTGHGIGLEIHEEPYLRQETSTTLRCAMTVTVEPGVYVPGLGGVRIEDSLVVTSDGHELLTRSPKDLVVL